MRSTGQIHTVFYTSKLTQKYTHFAEKKRFAIRAIVQNKGEICLDLALTAW